MHEGDVALRNLTYALFVALGRSPSADEVADATGWDIGEIRKGWERLHVEHALVLQPVSRDLLMANPFSAVPTAYRVHAAGRDWYANCAWDAFGICAAMHVDGHIDAICLDCGDELAVEVRDKQPDDLSLRFHCLVPASLWWEDIVFT